MIWIDFHGSTHGHFLEYVTNVWIMKMSQETGSVFTESGACHNFSEYYKDNRAVRCGHWWWTNYEHQHVTHPVIRITFDKTNDRLFYIALVNRWYRSGDTPFKQKFNNLPEDVRNSPERLRNQYYYKYMLRDKHIDGYNEFPSIPNPVQEFKFESLFIWSEFCKGLAGIAKFLNQTFTPDRKLYRLWQEFIELNQGYQSYNKCNTILENVFLEQSILVNCTSYEEAWINYNLTMMTGVDTGPMFSNDIYPINTLEIYKLIPQHV